MTEEIQNDLGELNMNAVTGETEEAQIEEKEKSPQTKRSRSSRSRSRSKKPIENVEIKVEDDDEPMELFFHPLVKSAKIPMFSTDNAAAFDLRACFEGHDEIIGYDDFNKKVTTVVRRNPNREEHIIIRPATRVKIPTGLMPIIPEGYKLSIVSRSGLSFTEGVTILNSPAVIDSDYTGVDQIWLLIKNTTASRIVINTGDRIAQCELVPCFNKKTLKIRRSLNRPVQNGNRTGGVGSTGKE